MPLPRRSFLSTLALAPAALAACSTGGAAAKGGSGAPPAGAPPRPAAPPAPALERLRAFALGAAEPAFTFRAALLRGDR